VLLGKHMIGLIGVQLPSEEKASKPTRWKRTIAVEITEQCSRRAGAIAQERREFQPDEASKLWADQASGGWDPAAPVVMSIFQSDVFATEPRTYHGRDSGWRPNRSRPCPCRPHMMWPGGSPTTWRFHRTAMRMMGDGPTRRNRVCNPLRSGPGYPNCAVLAVDGLA